MEVRPPLYPLVLRGKTIDRVWYGLEWTELFVLCTDGTLCRIGVAAPAPAWAPAATVEITVVQPEADAGGTPEPLL